jgi:hypothetical protein
MASPSSGTYLSEEWWHERNSPTGRGCGTTSLGGATSWAQASQLKVEDEENLALAGKGKTRAKKGSSWGHTSKGEKRKDLSKEKYFACSHRWQLQLQ